VSLQPMFLQYKIKVHLIQPNKPWHKNYPTKRVVVQDRDIFLL